MDGQTTFPDSRHAHNIACDVRLCTPEQIVGREVVPSVPSESSTAFARISVDGLQYSCIWPEAAAQTRRLSIAIVGWCSYAEYEIRICSKGAVSMWKKPTVILLIISFISVSPFAGSLASSASTIFEDFEDSATDSDKWLISVTGDGPQIAEESGQLIITVPADSKDAVDKTTFAAGYISRCTLRGDLDLQVDYSLRTWPYGNGVRVGLFLDSDQATPWQYKTIRISFGNGDFPGHPREAYLTAFTRVQGVTETEHLSGTLRFARSADSLTALFLDDGKWATIFTDPATEADLYFGVYVWSHDYAFTDQLIEVAFDNLIINQGELVCPDGVVTPTATSSPTPTATTESTPTPTVEATPTATLENTPTPTAEITPGPAAVSHVLHMPLVVSQPTATPTATPTLTATPTPSPEPTPTRNPNVLEDGYYMSSLDPSESGWIHFRVGAGGTRAGDAGFLIDGGTGATCRGTGFTFDTVATINNGYFGLVDLEALSRLIPPATLRCTATSPTTAECTASGGYSGVRGNCPRVTTTVTRQDY